MKYLKKWVILLFIALLPLFTACSLNGDGALTKDPKDLGDIYIEVISEEVREDDSTISISVYNKTTTDIKGWTLSADVTFTVLDIWNAIVSSDQDRLTITNETWTDDIPAGGSVTFGLVCSGKLSSGSIFNCTVNNIPAGVVINLGTPPVEADNVDDTWKKANLTNYESYPDPGSDECLYFNGCQWEGLFAFLDDKQPESWVMANNIASVHSKDSTVYKLKTLRLRKDNNTIDVVVYDYCSDSDCDGCCTEDSIETGFLIDIEKYTMERFGSGDGIVDWKCLDCN